MFSSLFKSTLDKRDRILKIASDVVFYGITLFIIFCLVSFAVTGKISGKPNAFGYRHFYVPTESMVPVIKPGQFVIAKIIEAEEVEEGDIIAFYSDDYDMMILHRVIEINTDENGELYFITKGDNNKKPDPFKVTKEMVKYKAVLY